MVIVEHDSKKFAIREPKENKLILTNHFVDSKLKRNDKVFEMYPKHNTQLRYDEVKKKLDEKGTNFEFSDIIDILGDKNSHTCQDKWGIRSIWSLSLNLKKKEYKLYYDLFGKRKEKVLKI